MLEFALMLCYNFSSLAQANGERIFNKQITKGEESYGIKKF